MVQGTSAMDRPIEKSGRFSRRQKLWMLVAAAALVAGALLYPSARRWASSEISIDVARIRLATVERGDLVRDVAVQGNIVAAFRPTLIAPARGIVRLTAKPGQVVATGDPLATVESPEVESRLEQERSTLRSLESELERQRILAKQAEIQARQDLGLLGLELEAAKRAMDRAERTRAEGILNDVEYERAQDDLEMAQLKLDLARESGELEKETLEFEISESRSRLERQRLVTADVERQVDELTIRSPVNGLVSRVMVNDRDSVTLGQPLLMVVDLSEFEIEVMIPESYSDEITPGTEAVITYDGSEYPGTVRSVSPEVEGSRVRGVVVFAGDAPEGLKQNQRVPTRLVIETRPDVLKVARGPFLESGGGRIVYRVEDGVAVRSPFEAGALSVSEIEVVSGLDLGDQIIVSDITRFDDAERVLLRD
ncbi:MAG: HlyD family efflux transporter periplasmic adaptor subunit [Thermoanaerobaculia bacterium]|nr:HlyD family efflux transporter periplasmic adaptor subunit [Thermoanaerobaculia bacterium]